MKDKGNIKVYFNDTQIVYNNEPYYYSNKKLLPFEETVEAFGCAVEYNEILGKYQAQINGYEISVTEGSATAEYDLIPFEMAYSGNDSNSVIYVNSDLFDKIYGFTKTEENNEIYINGEISQDSGDKVGEYLESLIDKITLLDNSSIFSSSVSNTSLLKKNNVYICRKK